MMSFQPSGEDRGQGDDAGMVIEGAQGGRVEGRAGLGGNGLALVDQVSIGEILLRCAGHEVHAHLGAAHHEGIAHVIPGITHVHQLSAGEAAEMLPDGQEVGQDLGGVELVGQAVPDADAGILCQCLHDLLTKAAVLNAVIHPAQNPGSIGNALLLAQLGSRRVQEGAVHSLGVFGEQLKYLAYFDATSLSYSTTAVRARVASLNQADICNIVGSEVTTRIYINQMVALFVSATAEVAHFHNALVTDNDSLLVINAYRAHVAATGISCYQQAFISHFYFVNT
mgnify:CR=1 FL=1